MDEKTKDLFTNAAAASIEKRMTDEEAAEIADEADDAEAPPEAPPVNEHEIPPWAKVPATLKMPVGRQVQFLKFKAEWTDTPTKGERQCIVWNLTDADEKLALKRARGDGSRALAELAKQTIRAIDGVKTDWTRGDLSNVNKWWDEIGAGCRQLVQAIYHKNHNLSLEDQADFFANCVAVRTVAAG